MLRSFKVRVSHPHPVPRSTTALGIAAAACVVLFPSASTAQGRVVDEGTFLVSRDGGPAATENFRITAIDNGQLQATGQVTAGTRRATSRFIADSLGTPIEFWLNIFDGPGRLPATEVHALVRGGRLSALTKNRDGDEAMHEYPVTSGRCLILDDQLVHLVYFVGLAKRIGTLEVIDPRGARDGRFNLSAHGLEAVIIGGKTVTGTHYTLSGPMGSRDFWTDASGLLLKLEIPAAKVVATREEPPR